MIALDDNTNVAGTTWENLKYYAMQPNYEEQEWFTSLPVDQQGIVNQLHQNQT